MNHLLQSSKKAEIWYGGRIYQVQTKELNHALAPEISRNFLKFAGIQIVYLNNFYDGLKVKKTRLTKDNCKEKKIP